MPKPNIDAPSWLRQMENILEELNEGVVIVDIPAKRAIAQAQRSDDGFRSSYRPIQEVGCTALLRVSDTRRGT